MPDFEGFSKFIAKIWFEGDCCAIEGDTIQEALTAFKIVREVEYDPERHGPNGVDAQPGDPWLVSNYEARP